MLSRLVYHLAKLSTDLPARVHAFIDLTPMRLSVSAIATGLHGGDALVMMHSRGGSNPSCVDTWLMRSETQEDPGVLINSRI